MITFNEPEIPQPVAAVVDWLVQHRPDCYMSPHRLRKLAELPGSGLPGVIVPSCGKRRKTLLFIRPADVVRYVESVTVQ